MTATIPRAAVALIGTLLCAGGCRKHTTAIAASAGVHEVCLSGDPASPWVLLIDDLLARDERGKVVETRARRVRPLNVHTGELREPFTFSMTGVFSTSRHCRGGVRSRTWFWTGEAGLQQREVATGKLTLASAQLRALVGDDASLAYDSATQGLIVTTKHNDKLLVDPDARTKRELPASAHGDDDPWISGHRYNLVPCAQRQPYPTFNCEGSRCRLAHSAIAGGTPGPPLPGAETLRVAAARC